MRASPNLNFLQEMKKALMYELQGLQQLAEYWRMAYGSVVIHLEMALLYLIRTAETNKYGPSNTNQLTEELLKLITERGHQREGVMKAADIADKVLTGIIIKELRG
ncbi:unnamed protein product [Nippostrongylus brasiliensis]|uniref:HEPN domain-containing protein n=1 Tax=Nippostrongylus brasiliensis TaxID=27835 RepID=A0A0N4YA17_NIPBR|nr:unnamed protein product [Nippostrongylus brasiliensis]